MLKAIIFDMDGVIIDSEPQHARAALQVLTDYGVSTDLEYCYSFIGSSTAEMAKTCVRQFHMSVSPEQLLAEINQAKAKLVRKEGYTPLPGVKELIQQLYKEGIALAIASSSSLAEIQHVVKTLGIQKYFDKLVSTAQVARPKPAPDIFHLTLAKLGVSPREALVIEDSQLGTEAAAAAGLTTVGYLNVNSGNQALEKAFVLLTSFQDLKPVFFENVLKRSHGEPITIANTRRLIIRELSEEDIPQIYQIYSDPQIRQYIDNIDDYLEAEMEKQRAYIRNVYSFYGYGLWGVFSKTSRQLIGRCGIENQVIDGREEIALSYLLDSQHWGYGYAIECCNAALLYANQELDIHRIVALIDQTNVRSLHTAQNLGMKPEKEVIDQGKKYTLYVKIFPEQDMKS